MICANHLEAVVDANGFASFTCCLLQGACANAQSILCLTQHWNNPLLQRIHTIMGCCISGNTNIA